MSLFLSAQSQVTLNGYVGINGPPSTGLALSVTSAYGQIINIDPGDNISGIAASTGYLYFWYDDYVGYNRLYARSYSTMSDSTKKSNISSLTPGALNKVLNLRPVTFNYKDEPNKKLKSIGLLAQEVEAIVPEAVTVSEVDKIKMIDYNMLVPVLIKAIQEQQSTIETLQTEIKDLKSAKENTKGTNISTDVEVVTSSISKLEQNAPNPFSQTTEIKYFLPEARQATLLIYNMNGIQIKSIPITQMGKGSIIIHGSELRPGMYLYTLIANGKEVDTKRMILTE